ncbi:neutral zinc metallopeptidase [Rivularia sp. UHCC 0363]|uniref:KPN_02809 family neutral zinc metallopeptidase n=1 Tax=Rivularia sp. UHCC 0363 TaxID=3110244 RepID=UPI002B20061C|nr:neutral zinc metallopeptidase [Rivularia sp. UHCC 0363]MEA5596599.1 neutral zinc metallopeptidase [Rivularia sp. UHCC 0363]
MRWEFGRRSDNVEDRRGRSVSPGLVGGGIGGLVLTLIAVFLGVDPAIINQVIPQDNGSSPTQTTSQPKDEIGQFVSVVLADTEDTWNQLFQQMGRKYREPNLVLFSDSVQSACGYADAAVGPFYCPPDQKVYLDTSFFRDLKNKLGAPGDFAQAYVIAHEVGHHVQNLMGISDKVRNVQSRVSKVEANQLSVRLELQADCFAGIWANKAQTQRQILEPGDIEEALNAASSIGDDRLQKQAKGYVVPESFTHGSSAQRVRWFKTGFQSGNIDACNTFS